MNPLFRFGLGPIDALPERRRRFPARSKAMHNHLFTIDQVRTFWDNVAPRYDDVNARLSWTHVERFLTMQEFLPRGPGLKIINVWSRTGGAIPYLRQACPDAAITNMEASDAMREIARLRYPNEVFLSTDLHELPHENESQDVVVSLETLEHVPDPLHFLLECHRVLKVGGRLILSAPPAWAEVFLPSMNGSSTTMARDRTVSRACKQSCKPSKAVASRSSRTAAPFCFLWVRRGQSARPNGYNRSSCGTSARIGLASGISIFPRRPPRATRSGPGSRKKSSDRDSAATVAPVLAFRQANSNSRGPMTAACRGPAAQRCCPRSAMKLARKSVLPIPR